ncbi:E3 ubiquitin protein ligase DRIP2 [Citrus sinensis]|uniref:RING-type domain-containing protein n=1 Tax=Citrus clementina TaxID=85681 RepID=V4U282_CITCL|nr:E3 ubiquitin protein ligase DRIP2 [Citrus x clementina]XP_024947951.2 E3 ubiquitin protein ligase DRIP2-like [Citrus sinensis]XP_024947952.2 E3 ubiquitin protein ligase DRIP2-like [Citrus sinensis]ESR33339.1 hypothetical protein CICLE_v10005027mg [Citrus x clementina]KAH9764624.1 E3 ubiquitin protein ligase DRIP2 [Citrus sinensis]
MTMATTEQTLKVNREKLVACMTCPLCSKLFRDATTISECLHSFCRKCIYEKITEEEIDSCPVCNTDLGCAPLEKLRADHNLQDLRIKIFPSKRRNLDAPDSVSSVPLPARRKEISLSSLAISTPKSPVKSSSSGRRSKPVPKKTLVQEEYTSPIEEPIKDVEDPPELSSEPLCRNTQTKRQILSATESSIQHTPDKGTEDIARPFDGKSDLWKPLNVLVEAASKTKANKSNSRGTVGKPILLDAHDNDLTLRTKLKDCGNTSKAHGNENGTIPGSSGSARPRKSLGRPKKAAVSAGLNVSAQAVVDTNQRFDGRFGPIWFSLVASDEQEGDEPLPQISSCYLRVKDGRLPVSFIKRYIVKKLNLISEAEVEISLRGQPVLSTLELHNLINWWVQTSSASERIQTVVGSSAKDFVMVLSYGRKAQPP